MTRQDMYALALALCHFYTQDAIKYALEAAEHAPNEDSAAIAEELALYLMDVLDTEDEPSITEEAKCALAAIAIQ